MRVWVWEGEDLWRELKAGNAGFGPQLILHDSILSLLIYNALSTYQSWASPYGVNLLGWMPLDWINMSVCKCTWVSVNEWKRGKDCGLVITHVRWTKICLHNHTGDLRGQKASHHDMNQKPTKCWTMVQIQTRRLSHPNLCQLGKNALLLTANFDRHVKLNSIKIYFSPNPFILFKIQKMRTNLML